MTQARPAVSAVLLLLTATAFARQPTTTPTQRSGVDPCGIVGNGDLVELTVFGVTGPDQPATFPLRVDKDGKIAVPYVGPVAIAGKSPDVAAQIVSDAFERAQIGKGLVVTLNRLESGDDPSVPPGDYAEGDGVRVLLYDIVGPGEPLVVFARVAENGTITLPYVGPVTVRGLDDNGANRAIMQLYRTKNVAQNTVVSVLKISSPAKN
jgi:protein involved in polysaccharide export with SLBB domain